LTEPERILQRPSTRYDGGLECLAHLQASRRFARVAILVLALVFSFRDAHQHHPDYENKRRPMVRCTESVTAGDLIPNLVETVKGFCEQERTGPGSE